MFKISPELSIALERSFLVTLILLGEKQRLHIFGKSFTFFVVEKVGWRGTLPGVWLAVPLLCSRFPTPFPLYSRKSAEKSAMAFLLCWHCMRHCHSSNGKLTEHSRVDRQQQMTSRQACQEFQSVSSSLGSPGSFRNRLPQTWRFLRGVMNIQSASSTLIRIDPLLNRSYYFVLPK